MELADVMEDQHRLGLLGLDQMQSLTAYEVTLYLILTISYMFHGRFLTCCRIKSSCCDTTSLQVHVCCYLFHYFQEPSFHSGILLGTETRMTAIKCPGFPFYSLSKI